MNTKTLRFSAVVALAAASFATACSKPEPCADIPGSKESDALGVVLDGGHLCKDDSGVINVDYDKPVEKVDSDYLSKLGDAGWKGEKVSSGANGSTSYFQKDKQRLLIVTLKNGDRNVTTAIIKHCMVVGAKDDNPVIVSCNKTIDELAKNLKKT